MAERRTAAGLVAVVLTALGLVFTPALPAAAVGEIAQLPTDNPANFTPNVLDGEVDSIWQIGNRVIVGGIFSQVANSDANGGEVFSRTNVAAFDATTGLVDVNFAPVLDGAVTSVIATDDPGSVYIGGTFNTVNGTNRRKVARVDLATGQLVSAFNAGGLNGTVKDMRLTGGQLYIAGLFTLVANQPRTYIASLNPTTGTLTTKMNPTFAGTHNGGVTNIYKMEVTPAGDRMLVIGNFATVDGLDRRQIAMLDLTTDPVTVAPWQTNWYTATCASAFDSYMRDLDISEDGTYAVVSTTGAFRANLSCDTISRFEVYTDQSNLAPTWVTYTGGDTTYAVEIHDGVAFAGGHMRWVNNPSAGDRPGPGAIPREGILALDAVNGMPYSWNPGRERGVGVFDFHVTEAGLWAGSDTERWNDEERMRLAFFSWSSGSLVPANHTGSVPNDVYLLGRTAGTVPADPSVLYRINAGGPAITSADDGPDWAADTSSTSTLRNSGSSTASYSAFAPFVDPSVPSADFDRAPIALFSTERFDGTTSPEMQWNFPVTAGTPIQVRLYMANRSTSTDLPGERVFDVDLDGVNVIDNIDLALSPGHDTASMRSFNITSDGTVNILFRHGVQNPLINGIEIIRTDLPVAGPLGVQDEVQRRFYNPVSGPMPTTVLAGTNPWKGARGAFMVNGTLYTALADGSFVGRSFDGTTFGPSTPVTLYGNTIISDLPTVTGMFYDPAQGRIYYTMTGQSSLFYRYFTPESNSVGAARFTATGAVAALNPSRVRGMFLSGGQIYLADTTTGQLLRIPFANGVVSGTTSVADATVDWRSRAMFVWNGVPAVTGVNTPPTAAFTHSCTLLDCSFDASGSNDIDGIMTFSWDFGDGQTGTGVNPSHTYAVGGSHTVTLTATDDDLATDTEQATFDVIAPDNVPPTAAFTSSCTFLVCTFDGTGSTDTDGNIVSYAWDFGDGNTDTSGANVAHTFADNGTYTVTLTVTDDDTGTDVEAADITVAAAVVTFRASAQANGNVGTATVAVPAAVQAGDQLLLFITANAATTVTTPAGWTLLGTQSDGTPDMRSWVFTRTAVAGTAGTNVSAALGATAKTSTVLVAYTQAKVPNVLASAVEGPSVADHASPPVAVAFANSAVVSYWSDKTNGNTGWTLPGSVTARQSSLGSGSGQISAAAGDSGPIAVGTFPGATATSSVASAKAISWSIVLVPIDAPAPNVPPTAAFTSLCDELSCTFDGTGSTDPEGPIVSYAWDFGDGATASGPNAAHDFAADGTYLVTLTVTDEDTATGTTSTNLSVEELPDTHLAFRASAQSNANLAVASVVVPGAVQAGDQLLLYVTTNAATTATTPAGWTLLGTQSDGTPDMRSWLFTRTAVAGTAGSTVTSTLGSTARTSTILVAYAGALVPTTFASAVEGPSVAAHTSPAVSVSAAGSVVVGYWSDKSGGNTGWTLPGSVGLLQSSLGTGSGSIGAVAGQSGPLPVTTFPGATATSSIASAKAISWSVVLAPTPNVAPTAVFTHSCNELSCTFDGTGSSDSDGSIVSYAWDFGDGGTATGATAAHDFAADGTYPVTLTVTDENSATGTVSVDVSVAAIPVTALEFRAAAASNGNVANPSVVVPAAVQSGDQLLLFVTANSATTVTTPAGWTLMGTQSDGNPDMRSWVFTRTADGATAGSTVVAPLGATSKVSAVLLAYAGAAVPTVIASAVEGATAAAHASPPVLVAAPGSLVVGYWSDKTGGNTGWTLPGTVTERQSSLGSGAGQISAVAGDSGPVSIGTFPGATATSSTASAKAISWSIVVAPA